MPRQLPLFVAHDLQKLHSMDRGTSYQIQATYMQSTPFCQLAHSMRMVAIWCSRKVKAAVLLVLLSLRLSHTFTLPSAAPARTLDLLRTSVRISKNIQKHLLNSAGAQSSMAKHMQALISSELAMEKRHGRMCSCRLSRR